LNSIPEKLYLGFLKLAREYTNLEKYDLAETYFQLIEKSYPDNREFLFYRGKSFYYSGNPKKAIPFLIKVNKSSAAYFLTAKAYATIGDQANTEKYIRLATDIKDSYWQLAKEEDDFDALRKNSNFMEFLNTKGKVSSVTPMDQDPSKFPSTNPE